jgi:twitching motility protein PilT
VRLSLAAALRGIVGQRLVPQAGDGGRVAVLEVMVDTGRTAEAIADPERTGDLSVATNPRDLQVALRSQGLVA